MTAIQAIGYMILAAQSLKYDDVSISLFKTEMMYQILNKSESQAQDTYKESQKIKRDSLISGFEQCSPAR